MSGSGPGPGPGPSDDHHYYHHRGATVSYYTQPPSTSTVPPRRPVAGTAAAIDQARVSPPELSYALRPARTSSSGTNQTRMPQRMGTISSGGKFTVSPASSIHEEDDDDDDIDDDGDDEKAYGGYGGGPAGLSPSPPGHYRNTRGQAHGGGWGEQAGQVGMWHGQAQTQGQTQTTTATGPGNDNTRAVAGGVAPPAAVLWQTHPDETDIPYPAPPHWRGSRDLQELNEARAREAESGRRPVRTSYGPAPARAAAAVAAAPASYTFMPVVPAPAPVHTPGTVITPAVSVQAPASASAPSPWQQTQTQHHHHHHQQQQPPNEQPHPPNRVQEPAPFMHYEDLDYFHVTPAPGPDSEPKDESQIDIGVPPADTFPPIPEDLLNRPKARRSWDRQRKRRRKKADPGLPGGGNGDGGGGGRRWGRGRGEKGGGSGGFIPYCAHWLPEMLCCLLGVVCLAVIVAVLKTYDGRGLADWPLSVSLNTLVAFLAAICQVALAVPLTEGLAQLKWNSFARGEKPLADFQAFEDARRGGPVGSAVLLCKRKGRALGMSAATALLTGFLLSPLTQGAITYPTRSFEAGSGTATIARSESYAHPAPYETLDTREKQAIQSGIYHAVDAAVPHLQPLCSSGDCQWRNFSSLAVCGAVADVSDRLTVSNEAKPKNLGVSLGDAAANNELVRAARLPNGLFLAGGTTSCNLNVSWPASSVNAADGGGEEESFLPARTSLAFSDQDGRVTSAIANFFLVYTNQTAELPSGSQQQAVFRAAEVLLHFCVNTYEASTSRGVSTSRVVHSSTLAAEDGTTANALVNARDTSLSSSPSSSRRVVLRSADAAEGVYSVKRDDVKLLNGYILPLFAGTYSQRYGKAIRGETATSEALGLAMFQREPCDDVEMRAVVSNLTANVATSLTNTMRAMSSASASGTVLSTETYVHIRWAWLTFLAIQIVLSVSFLVGIMVQTAVWNVKILKGSSTAALLAISADDKAYLEERENLFLDGGPESEMARKMKTITCRFRPGERGWGLELGKREVG
ncbi:hypothetical protein C8A01DRAFT_32244 [Parachaetomium inaequale]|uniref:Uncharacterized protein n=1 Tax=Parachaetomium inaequale TaxID=2588326 RepID=A0AAN6SVF7_9PEZI|nr:hypothetical protein C8A01DRAFT_32244 [Parachaetomium inaequale]